MQQPHFHEERKQDGFKSLNGHQSHYPQFFLLIVKFKIPYFYSPRKAKLHYSSERSICNIEKYSNMARFRLQIFLRLESRQMPHASERVTFDIYTIFSCGYFLRERKTKQYRSQ